MSWDRKLLEAFGCDVAATVIVSKNGITVVSAEAVHQPAASPQKNDEGETDV